MSPAAVSLACYSLLGHFLHASLTRDLGSVLTVAAWAIEESNVLRRAIGFRPESHSDWRLDCIVVELSLLCF
jgi:hypothetical protein